MEGSATPRYFGWNLIPEMQGTIRVGEAVEVLEKAPTPAQNQK